MVITATGAVGVVTGADLGLLKDDAVLCNAGHFPTEIAVDELTGAPDVAEVDAGGRGHRHAPPG